MISADDHADVIIVGGGHNGLVAAALLARAGRRVLLYEANNSFGGAVASQRIFPGVAASLSRYSYLVSLLPQALLDDLEVTLELRSRSIASYTPTDRTGLLISRTEDEETRRSFEAATGTSAEYPSWQRFHAEIAAFAKVVAPTLLGPLPHAADLRAQAPEDLWTALTERPLGELIEARLADDTVRGIVVTDALIGTFTHAHDPTLRQNRCFLYHVIGNGTGEWKVPVGGMGAVAAALEQAARTAGARLRSAARVVGIDTDDQGVLVRLADGSTAAAPYLLANCAPAVLAELTGESTDRPEGNQTKINLVVRRLPRFRSGLDPAIGFAGTLHINQGYRRLAEAYAEAEAGQIPDPLPCEIYCHTLTDPSILGPELERQGVHTLTLFGLHTPARLFVDDPDCARHQVLRAALRSVNEVLAEPLEDCVLTDADGNPCIEVMMPMDVESALNMPGGHIFHGDFDWPWLADDVVAATPAGRWGVATAHPRILLCGSGSVRAGAVSGLGGHSAAMALLEMSPAGSAQSI